MLSFLSQIFPSIRHFISTHVYQIWGVYVKIWWIEAHISWLPSFSLFPILSVAVGYEHQQKKLKYRLASLQKLRHGYFIRLTHILAAFNNHKLHAMPKTIPS